MYKIVSLILVAALLVRLIQARPSYLHSSGLPAAASYTEIEFAPTVVGHELHHLPAAVSHQSQTIVHEKRPYLRPIIEHTPVLKTHYTPLVKSYAPSTAAAELPLAYTSLAYTGLYDHHLNSAYDSPAVYATWSGWPLK